MKVNDLEWQQMHYHFNEETSTNYMVYWSTLEREWLLMQGFGMRDQTLINSYPTRSLAMAGLADHLVSVKIKAQAQQRGPTPARASASATNTNPITTASD